MSEADTPKTTISARVTVEALEVLKKLGDKDERTLSYMVDKAIREYVERNAPKSKGQK